MADENLERVSKLDRVQVVAENEPVTVGEAIVTPGDILRGDSDGVIVIPRGNEDEVLAVAEDIDVAEQEIRSDSRQVHGLMSREKNWDITACKRLTSDIDYGNDLARGRRT